MGGRFARHINQGTSFWLYFRQLFPNYSHEFKTKNRPAEAYLSLVEALWQSFTKSVYAIHQNKPLSLVSLFIVEMIQYDVIRLQKLM